MYLLIADTRETACEVTLGGEIEEVRAGDGARTRDSLLGRQVFARSPLAWHE
jgi:hypothetical protein